MRRVLTDKEAKRVAHIFKMITENDHVEDWELNFIISVEEQFKKDNKLSDEQLTKLEEVYERIQSR